MNDYPICIAVHCTDNEESSHETPNYDLFLVTIASTIWKIHLISVTASNEDGIVIFKLDGDKRASYPRKLIHEFNAHSAKPDPMLDIKLVVEIKKELYNFSAPDTTGDVTTTWGTTGSKTTSTDLNRTHLSSLPTATTSNVSRNHTKHSKRSVFVDEQRVFPKSDYVYNEEMSSEDYDETDLRSVQPTIRHTRTDG